MNRKEIMDAIQMLAQSQGFYSRMYNAMREADVDDLECFLNELESQNFKDTVDMVMYFES